MGGGDKQRALDLLASGQSWKRDAEWLSTLGIHSFIHSFAFVQRMSVPAALSGAELNSKTSVPSLLELLGETARWTETDHLHTCISAKTGEKKPGLQTWGEYLGRLPGAGGQGEGDRGPQAAG